MIEKRSNKLFVNGNTLPKGDSDLITHLLRSENGLSAFQLMGLTGKIYVQYIQNRLRTLVSIGIVVKTGRGIYEINPELREELKKVMEIA